MSCSQSDDIGRVVFLQDLQRVDYSIAATENSLDTSVANFEHAQQQMMASMTSAYQSFVAFRQEFSRLQELRRQREQFSPMILVNNHRRVILVTRECSCFLVFLRY